MTDSAKPSSSPTKPDRQTPASAAYKRRWIILSALGIGTIMGPLDGSVVNIALPQIQHSFGTSLAAVEWVAMVYLLVISSLLLTYGRLGDLYGHRPIYLAGFSVFTVGSLLCSLSPTLASLLAFRALQAIGAGMLMAAGPAILTEVFPSRERGQALGINAVAVAVGLAAGPVLGGYLVSRLGWRSIFYINLPIGIMGTAWAAHVIPLARPTATELTTTATPPTPPPDRVMFDPWGAAAISLSLAALLLGINYGESWGWLSAAVLSLLLGGLALLAAFVVIERRHPAPVVALGLFRNRLYSAANVSALLNFVTQSMITFLMPFYLQNLLGLGPARAGELLISFPLIMMVTAPFAGWLSDRIGSLWLAAAGMAIMAIASLLLSQLHASSTGLDIFWRLGILGLGGGLFQSPNNSAIMGSVPRRRLGQASGMLATMRNVGMVLGVAVGGAVFSGRQAIRLSQLQVNPDLSSRLHQAFILALHDTFLVAAGLAILAAFASLVRGRPATAAEHGGAGAPSGPASPQQRAPRLEQGRTGEAGEGG